ncbi:MAG: outer membrane lipoprotein-sorting protein [Bacteroidales bacterium]|jgi:outer membrane lipoprotein-sorting protein|nr:outer membrane lipoprotein-sorting protein [Bacteroidales bacterium]
MKIFKNRIILLSLFLFAGLHEVSSQDAMTILNKMDDVMFSPKDRQGKVTIILTDRTGKEKIREAVMYEKGPEKKLYRYTKPESQAGMATLTQPGSVMWLYLPALGNPKKISILSKDQSFNNTDFSYEDMAQTPYAERYTPSLLETDEQVYMLSMQPKSGRSNYSKVIVRINIMHGYPESMEYYDQKGKKFKEAAYRYEKIGKYWNAAEVVMRDLEKDHSTKILLTDVKFDQGIPDDLFQVENLKPLKTQQ